MFTCVLGRTSLVFTCVLGRTSLVFTCVLGRYEVSTVLLVGYLNFSEGADNVGGAEIKIE